MGGGWNYSKILIVEWDRKMRWISFVTGTEKLMKIYERKKKEEVLWDFGDSYLIKDVTWEFRNSF